MRKQILIFLLLAAQVCLAQFHQPVNFSVRQDKVSANELEIVFTGTVEPGWHVYGADIPDGGPTRAELTLNKQKGLKPVGSLRATGNVQRQHDAMFGMEVSFMADRASFAQRFVITAPTYEVAGYLTYGACNDMNCLPPTDVEFSFGGSTEGSEKTGTTTLPTSNSQPSSNSPEGEKAGGDSGPGSPDSPSDTMVTSATSATGNSEAIPSPRGGQDVGAQKEASQDGTLWKILLWGFLGGLAALLTPCVWPIIPMTVSFFLKRAKGEGQETSAVSRWPLANKGVRDAVIYGLSIIAIYMALGLLVTLLFGASALNALSTNAVFNIFFFLLLVLFGISFLGGFEITLPSSWSTAVDNKATRTTGLLSIFLMAFTLSLVSFSCTGPIIGFLLVEVASSGNLLGPAMGMFGFSLALALPFTLFALFPSWLKRAPKSGSWMNCIKVCLGFVELAFSLKFLSVADLAYGWHILDREVFLALWIVLFAMLGAYLIGWVRFPHDEEEYDEMGEIVLHHRTSVTRFVLSLFSFAFALYMVPGLWGAPCKAVSAFAPPMTTQDWRLGSGDPVSGSEVHNKFTSYEEGMAYAKKVGKPVMLDFTGYGCVNCRKMEAAVWTHPEVKQLMDEEFVVISLWVDDKTPLTEPVTVTENGKTRQLRTVGDKWSYLQRSEFGANAQPFYVLVDGDGHPLTEAYSYNEDVASYVRFLQKGLSRYK